jgi:hypothetical protein
LADAQGRISERKRLSRNAVARCLVNRPPLQVVTVIRFTAPSTTATPSRVVEDADG